jgi:hypothetical protein
MVEIADPHFVQFSSAMLLSYSMINIIIIIAKVFSASNLGLPSRAFQMLASSTGLTKSVEAI